MGAGRECGANRKNLDGKFYIFSLFLASCIMYITKNVQCRETGSLIAKEAAPYEDPV